jgi:CheY-like chemotaxis protein
MRTYNILLIDNDWASQCFAKEALSGSEIEIQNAQFGMEAIDIFRKNSFFDLVITEMVLADIDGYEVLMEIRKINSTVPIVALTAYSEFNIDNQCIEYGFDCFLEKPISVKTFVENINIYVNCIHI